MIVQLCDPVLPCVGDRVWVRVNGVDRLARVTFIAQAGALVRVSLSASNFCGEAILVLPERKP